MVTTIHALHTCDGVRDNCIVMSQNLIYSSKSMKCVIFSTVKSYDLPFAVNGESFPTDFPKYV